MASASTDRPPPFAGPSATTSTTYDVEALLAPQPEPVAAADPRSGPAPTTPTTVGRRVPDAGDPLRIYVGGDSMARELADGLGRVTPTDSVLVRGDHRVSSGLARPDFVDWPQRLAQVVVEQQPDVIVLIFGSNDNQDMETAGGVLRVGSQAWTAEYRARVGTAMDLAHQGGRTVVWVGLPVMRSADYDRSVAAIDALQREEASERPWVRFVDGRALFAGPDGGYREALSGGDGEVVVRQEDGVHWSIEGSSRVGRAAWSQIAPEWDLPVE